MKHKHYDLIVQWAADPEGFDVYRLFPEYREHQHRFRINWNPEGEYELVLKAKPEYTVVRVDNQGEFTFGCWTDEKVMIGDAIGHFRRDNPDATPVFVPVGGESEHA